MTIDVDGIVDRLREVHGVDRDTLLAGKLGLASSVPGNWRHRGTPPYHTCAEVAQREGISLDWLIFGEGPKRRARPETCKLPVLERLRRFLLFWEITHGARDAATLEKRIREAIPDYREWLASNPMAE